MIIYWDIHFVNRVTREKGIHHLFLDTKQLEPNVKTAIETYLKLKGDYGRIGCDFMQYRRFFTEIDKSSNLIISSPETFEIRSPYEIPNYFEDENGTSISLTERTQILTGEKNIVCFPSGTRPHDAILALSKPVVDLGKIKIESKKLDDLSYFVRDYRDLAKSTFFQEGPGTIEISGLNRDVRVKTAFGDDEIKSFATIFRSLNMKDDRGIYLKAIDIVATALGDHPLTNWLNIERELYVNRMDSKPQSQPWITKNKWTISTKDFLEIVYYSKLFHQPKVTREAEYLDCLKLVNGNHNLLLALFLHEIYALAVHIFNGGQQIAQFYQEYCQCYEIQCATIPALSTSGIAFGSIEKSAERKTRILREQSRNLGHLNWEAAGCPKNRLDEYIAEAYALLSTKIP